MKTIVAFAILGLVAVTAMPFTEEQQKKAQEYIGKCIKETGATAEDAVKLKSGDFNSDDDKVQCFAHCFLREAQMVDDKGNQNRDVIIAKLSTTKDKKEVEKVYGKCKDAKGTSPCNKSFNAYKCYRDSGIF